LAVALHITRYAQPGKSSEGEQNGKETAEEGQEDPPDQAVDQGEPRLGLPFQRSSMPGSAPRMLAGKFQKAEGCRREAGGPFCLLQPPPTQNLRRRRFLHFISNLTVDFGDCFVL
jgi:hypothetical protein